MRKSKSDIDAKICKKVNNSSDADGACRTASQPTTGDNKKWSEWFVEQNTDWKSKEHTPWSAHNAGVVSKDTAALSSGDI